MDSLGELELNKIRKLIGPATADDLKFVDSYISRETAIFMPSAGACFYALRPLHTHPSYMFCLTFNDETSLKINGRVIKSAPGHFTAVSPGVAHQELPGESVPRYAAIFVAKRYFEIEARRYGMQSPPVFTGQSYSAPDSLRALVKTFMVEADNRMPGRESVLYGLAVEITHSILRSVFTRYSTVDRVSERMEVGRALEFVHANLSEKLSLRKIAKTAGMSVTHFCRVFREETGLTPMGYLRRIRAEKAKKLLLAGASMTEAAFECGYSTPSQFSTAFGRRYSMTPTEFVNAFKKSGISIANKKKRKE